MADYRRPASTEEPPNTEELLRPLVTCGTQNNSTILVNLNIFKEYVWSSTLTQLRCSIVCMLLVAHVPRIGLSGKQQLTNMN